MFRAVREPRPYDARWRRWFKRSRAAARWLPFPRDEEVLAVAVPGTGSPMGDLR